MKTPLKNKENEQKKNENYFPSMYTHVYLMFINVHHHRNKSYKATHKYRYMMLPNISSEYFIINIKFM